MIINLLCPTRGRPEKYVRMVNSAIATAAQISKLEIWGGKYSNDNVSYNHGMRALHETSGRGAGPYWNQLAGQAYSKHPEGLYLLVGDDCVFETQGWDDYMRVVAEQFPDGIYALAPNDKRTQGGAPHFAVSHRWIETLGYFVNPAFQHFCVDTYTQYLAEGVGRFKYLEHVVIAHQKAAEQHYDQTAHRIRQNRTSSRDNMLKKTLIEYGFAQDDIELLKAAMNG